MQPQYGTVDENKLVNKNADPNYANLFEGFRNARNSA
jgi:hypothetical protein